MWVYMRSNSLFPEVDQSGKNSQSSLMEEPTGDLTQSNIVQDGLNDI